MEFVRLPAFEKDFKKLLKRFRSLEADLDVLKKALAVYKHPQEPVSFRVSGLGVESPVIIKVKKMACRSLGGTGSSSGLRVIYAYLILLDGSERIEFVEIYYKGDKENEDRERIRAYLS